MKLGMLTGDPGALGMISEIGYDSASFSTGPGRPIDAGRPETVEDAVREARRLGLEVTALGFYGNPLVPDPEGRKEQVDYWGKLLDLASELEVGVVTGFPGRGEKGIMKKIGLLLLLVLLY